MLSSRINFNKRLHNHSIVNCTHKIFSNFLKIKSESSILYATKIMNRLV